MHNTANFRQEEKALSCVEISKMEALEKLIGLVHGKHRCKSFLTIKHKVTRIVYEITFKDLKLLQKYDAGYLIELYWFPYFVHKNHFNVDVLAGDQSQFAKNSTTKFLATENVISHGGAQKIGLNGELTMFTIDLFGTEGLVCVRSDFCMIWSPDSGRTFMRNESWTTIHRIIR